MSSLEYSPSSIQLSSIINQHHHFNAKSNLGSIIQCQKQFQKQSIDQVFSQSNRKLNILQEKMRKLLQTKSTKYSNHPSQQKRLSNQNRPQQKRYPKFSQKFKLLAEPDQVDQKLLLQDQSLENISSHKNQKEKINQNFSKQPILTAHMNKKPSSKSLLKLFKPGKSQSNKQNDKTKIISDEMIPKVEQKILFDQQSRKLQSQINSYEMLFKKSIEIKQRTIQQLIQQIEQIQQQKLFYYRKGKSLQNQLQAAIPQTHSGPLDGKQNLQFSLSQTLDSLKTQFDQLKVELQQKSQKGKQSRFQVGALERQYQRLLKSAQKTQRQVSKGHSNRISNRVSESESEDEQRFKQYLQKTTPKSLICKDKSLPQRKPSHNPGSTDRLLKRSGSKHSHSKSTLPPNGMTSNRHAHGHCQSDHLLHSMISELDKLKLVINKEIQKSKSGKVKQMDRKNESKLMSFR